jgi:hypothetical protein
MPKIGVFTQSAAGADAPTAARRSAFAFGNTRWLGSCLEWEEGRALTNIRASAGGVHEHPLCRMVRDSSLPLDGQRPRRRTVRTNCAYTAVECVATIVLRDYPTRYWSSPAKVLDSRPYSYHYLPHSGAGLDVEAGGGAPPPAHRTRLLYRHARLEWSLFHP